jgi:predicted membrane chloride channel (bestrophin family)
LPQASLWAAAGLNPTYKVSGAITGEPSFTRLFSHEDWRYYTGKSPIRRWLRTVMTWRYSTVLRALWPISLIAAIWAFLISSLPGALLPRTSPVPMSLFGQALGLLLVFRTNNTYQRLNEARALWGRAVFLTRNIAQGVATALLFDDDLPQKAAARDAAAASCRYLAAFG